MPNSSLTRKIGENLRKIRSAKNVSQHELARESGVSLSLINWIELGKRDNVTIKTLEKVAKTLNTTFHKLVEV